MVMIQSTMSGSVIMKKKNNANTATTTATTPRTRHKQKEEEGEGNKKSAPRNITSRTILRVKRRRDASSLPCTILLENDDGENNENSVRKKRRQNEEMNQLSDLLHSNTYIQHLPAPVTAPSTTPSTAAVASEAAVESAKKKRMLFRRIPSTVTNNNSSDNKRSRSFEDDTVQVVDARLNDLTKKPKTQMSLEVVTSHTLNQYEFWKDPTSPQTSHPSPSKQKNKSNSKNQNQKLILHPIDRLVDDKLTSLSSAHENHHELILHYLKFLKEELPLLQPHHHLHHSSLPQSSSQQKLTALEKYINFKCQKGGSTLLHICALYNDVQAAKLAISHNADVFIKDDDDCTPYDLATLVGSRNVGSVLEYEMTKLKNEEEMEKKRMEEKKEDEEGEYVFDVYCLEEEQDKTAEESSSKDKSENPTNGAATLDNNNNTSLSSSKEEQPAKIHLQNTIGYFDENDRLVLEPSNLTHHSHANDTKMNSDDDEDEDGYDSNHEGYNGNDYPEDEEDDDEDEENSMYNDNHQHAFYNPRYHDHRNQHTKNDSSYTHDIMNDDSDDHYYNGGGGLSGVVVGGESWKYSSYYDANSYGHGRMTGGNAMDAHSYSSDEDEVGRGQFRNYSVDFVRGRYSVTNIQQEDEEEDDDGEYSGKMYGSGGGGMGEDDCALNRFAYDSELDMDH